MAESTLAARAVRLARLSQATKEAERAYQDAREARDAEIDRAEEDGWSVRALARACDVAPATVLAALARQAGKRK